ncbi:MAG TPA: TonB-dependent receptor [Terriglobia bacterium]|nr:TonB-dependent receptor [Terriglobia bacterium]
MNVESTVAKSARRKLAGLILTSLLGAGAVWGSVTGSISGTVTDSSGAIVSGAAVVAVNTETNVRNSTETNAAGFYSLPALPPGHYEVQIKATGFEQYRQTALVVDVNSALRVDATLQVGAVTQEVSVSATAAHVETTNTQMGEIIGTAKMTTLPLNGRSFTDLLALQPGVVPVSSGEYGGYNGPPGVSGSLNPGNLSISGQRESANGFMVNGGDDEAAIEMGAALIPNLDSIAEFRIVTNNGDAEYGNYAGGLINVITKSGTNQFHGDAFEFIRNPDLDSRNFFSPARADLHQNQFGGTVGGPIRHDKGFFFSDYQGTRLVAGVDTGVIPVPSVADRTGNLADMASQLTGTVGGSSWAQTLSQELGYPVKAGEAYYAPGCTASTACVFPNAVVPQTAFTAPTKALMQYIPLPNVGSDFFTTSAYDQTLRDDKGSVRLDVNSRLGMLSGYYSVDDFNLLNPYGGASVPGFAASSRGKTQLFNLGLIKSFGPDSVNEVRVQYLRNFIVISTPAGGLGPSLSSQGFVVGRGTSGIVPLAPYQGVEPVGFNNFSIGRADSSNTRPENTYQALDNFAKVKGTHTIKFGGSFHYDQVTYFQNINNNGSFSFSGSETGVDFADFLIGAPTAYVQGQEPPMYTRDRYFALYAQDSWRAAHNLTLNYGLRWEVSSPWWEAHNEIQALVPGQQSRVYPGAPVGWDFPGDPGVPSTVAPTRYHNFAPRIGLAYAPDVQGGFLGKVLGGPGKTSVRAGFGIYYTAFEDVGNINSSDDAPFGNFWVSPEPPLFASPFIDRGTGNNEGQRFPVPLPPLNVGPKNPDNSINWSIFEPISSSPTAYLHNRVPYAEEYEFSIQRQFGLATLLSLSYVGSQGHRLIASLEANPGNPALCLSVSQASQVMPGTPTCGPFGENGTYFPVSGGVINSTRAPFGPAFGSNDWFDTMANSNYNALEVSFRHVVGRLELLAGYTYSKSLDNASGWGGGQGDAINPLNYKITKALSAFDATNNFVTSYRYRLPFDKLRLPSRLASGWAVSGITRFSTGLPVFLTEPDDNSLLGTAYGGPTGNTVDEPNFTPGNLQRTDPRKANPATGTNPYFNIALFSAEPLGGLGTASRRFFHGPGINNWDMALTKDLKLTESKQLQFRAEFFNTFNHAQFEEPQGNFLSSAFGFVTRANPGRIGQVAAKLIF